MELPLNYEDIVRILPHRYPFLLVDRITELEIGERVVGIKNVTSNEPFFEGHFPGNPIMPGVLIIEAMAQVGGILALLTIYGPEKREYSEPVFFMAIDKAKFRRPVVPGDQLIFEVLPIRKGSSVWKMNGLAHVEGKTVAEAELVAMLSP